MNTPRILIVDDMEDIRKLYRSILTAPKKTDNLENIASDLFGEDGDDFPDIDEEIFEESVMQTVVVDECDLNDYELIEVSQGADGVNALKEAISNNQPFCLVFLDMRMPPGIDGMETAKQIRALDPFVEIVIMTAYSDYTVDEIKTEISNPDRLLYFRKPFQPAQIKQLAASLSQKWFLEKKIRDQENT